MAVPRLRVPASIPGGSLRQAAGLVSDEVELYHRTYTTLLRSSGETLLRVLEPSHRSMNSSDVRHPHWVIERTSSQADDQQAVTDQEQPVPQAHPAYVHQDPQPHQQVAAHGSLSVKQRESVPTDVFTTSL